MSQNKYRILLADDEKPFRLRTRTARPLREAYNFEEAATIQDVHHKLKKKEYDLLLLDLDMNNNGISAGLKLIPQIKESYPYLPIIVVTKDGKIPTVVKAINLGAKDYLHKMGLDYQLCHAVFQRVITNNKNEIRSLELEKENIGLKAKVRKYEEKESAKYPFIGESPQIKEVKRTLKVVAKHPDVTVLITGETGVGKEVAARYLHRHSARRDKPFVGVNLSAIQKSLLEATLFGSKKGGYTGASRDIQGYFEQANGGILMLDEIGDIDADIQIKLLRFLESRLIRPIGSDQDVQLDVQIVAATHQDMRRKVEEGQFREDLFQRLKMMVVDIPPLRDRKEDIPLIVNHYLEKEGLPANAITPQARLSLIQYDWRGNIRELANSISSMVLQRAIYEKEQIGFDCLPLEIRQGPKARPSDNGARLPESTTAPDGANPEEEKALIDLSAIEDALSRKNGKKKDVADVLGYGKSDNLRYKVKTLHEKFPHLFEPFRLIKKSYPKITS